MVLLARIGLAVMGRSSVDVETDSFWKLQNDGYALSRGVSLRFTPSKACDSMPTEAHYTSHEMGFALPGTEHKMKKEEKPKRDEWKNRLVNPRFLKTLFRGKTKDKPASGGEQSCWDVTVTTKEGKQTVKTLKFFPPALLLDDPMWGLTYVFPGEPHTFDIQENLQSEERWLAKIEGSAILSVGWKNGVKDNGPRSGLKELNKRGVFFLF